MKKRITQCFNKAAATYHQAATLQTTVAENLSRYINGTKAHRILELGCGTGIFSEKLFKKFPTANFMLTDIAPAMLDVCQKKFRERKCIQYACQDAEQLSVNDSYDLITSNMTLHWLNNIPNSFEKIISKLSARGEFIFSLLGKKSLYEWQKICDEYSVPFPMPLFDSNYILKNLFPLLEVKTELIKMQYKNIQEFLQSLKKIGAHATPEHYEMISPAKMRTILRKFNQPIEISYEVIYGKYIKP